MQRPRIGAAEPGARIDREAAEHRLALDAALDREIAERAAFGEAEVKRFSLRKRHRAIEDNRAPGDIAAARHTRKRNANRAVARGEFRAERADLDGCCQRFAADQRGEQFGDDLTGFRSAILLRKRLGIDGEEGNAVAGFGEEDRLAMQLIGPHRGSAQQMPAAWGGEALDAGLHAAD